MSPPLSPAQALYDPTPMGRVRSDSSTASLALQTELLEYLHECLSSRDWKEKSLCAVVASNHLCCTNVAVVSSCFDAGRIGRPSQELLLHTLWLPTRGVGCPLPPRVPKHEVEVRDTGD